VQRDRPWTKPTTIEETNRLPPDAANAPAPTGRVSPVMRATGHWNACDFWVNLDDSWLDVTFRITCVVGNVITWSETKAFTDIENPLRAGGRTEGILFSVKRMCEHFVVEAWATAVDHPEGMFRMECSYDPAANPGDRNTRIVVDPNAGRHQQVQFPATTPPPAVPIPAGTTVIVPVNPTGGRSYLTFLMWSTDDNAQQQVTVLTRNPGTGVITDRCVFFTARVVPVVLQWVYPFRSDPGDDWEVTLGGATPGTSHFCTVIAFNE
jgi:hypothetical protein